jgi:hypothetical protein
VEADLQAYIDLPPTAEEALYGQTPIMLDLDDDDIDYEVLYANP